MSIIEWLSANMLTCSFKSLTGFDCPGCGNQRALIALLQGDIKASVQLYPALIFQLVTIIYTIAHIFFSFRKGARNIIILFSTTMAITIGYYIYRIIIGEVVIPIG